MRRLLPQGTRSQRSLQLERGVGLSLVALLGPSRSVGCELGFRSEPRGGRAARSLGAAEPLGLRLASVYRGPGSNVRGNSRSSVVTRSQETRRPVFVTP